MIRVLASIICAGLPLLAQSGLKDQVSQDFLHFRSANLIEREAAFYDVTKIGCPICQQSSFPIIDGIENAVHFGATSREELAQNLIALVDREVVARLGTDLYPGSIATI